MSNKRALWKENEYASEIAKCNLIIAKSKNWKTVRDFTKHKERLLAELREYRKNKMSSDF